MQYLFHAARRLTAKRTLERRLGLTCWRQGSSAIRARGPLWRLIHNFNFTGVRPLEVLIQIKPLRSETADIFGPHASACIIFLIDARKLRRHFDGSCVCATLMAGAPAPISAADTATVAMIACDEDASAHTAKQSLAKRSTSLASHSSNYKLATWQARLPGTDGGGGNPGNPCLRVKTGSEKTTPRPREPQNRTAWPELSL